MRDCVGVDDAEPGVARVGLKQHRGHWPVQLRAHQRQDRKRAQKLSADSLTQIARMSTELRVQVTQWLVTLLANQNADVRQRAGRVLYEMNEGKGESAQNSRDAAMAGGVEKLVELLRDGLKNDRVEAQEYALWSLSLCIDESNRGLVVDCGAIEPLVEALTSVSITMTEQAASALSKLASKDTVQIIAAAGAISPLIALLDKTDSDAVRQHAAGAPAPGQLHDHDDHRGDDHHRDG